MNVARGWVFLAHAWSCLDVPTLCLDQSCSTSPQLCPLRKHIFLCQQKMLQDSEQTFQRVRLPTSIQAYLALRTKQISFFKVAWVFQKVFIQDYAKICSLWDWTSCGLLQRMGGVSPLLCTFCCALVLAFSADKRRWFRGALGSLKMQDPK